MRRRQPDPNQPDGLLGRFDHFPVRAGLDSLSRSTHKPSPLLRWLSVVLRGMHQAVVVGLGAAILGAQLPMHAMAIGVVASGVALFLVDLWTKPRLLLERSGAALILKLGAVAWMALDEQWRAPLFWLIVVWSTLFAHAPSYFRHARWWGGG